MNDAGPENRQLVERAAQGDARAVEELLAQHLPALRAYVRLRTGPMLRAKESNSDIVQSVCRDVLANLERFRYPGDAAFKAWLYSTALRKIADRAEYWGAGKRDPARERTQVGATSATDAQVLDCYRTMCTPSQVAMGREALERIEGAFERLQEDYREVIVLSRIVGLSRAEVAQQMDRTEASIRNLLSRALAQLAEEMERGEGAATG